jgi:hypothetical protein
MESEEGRRPTPAMMPRRRPAIPPAQRPPARASFLVAAEIPRRGPRGAIVWPDTGVLLGLGTDQAMLDRFRRHYRGRIRLTKLVCRELRAQSEIATGEASDEEYDRITAATRAVQALLIGERALPVAELADEDLTAVENVTEQLKALSEGTGKRHSGEAELIVLATKQAALDQHKHILLSNDGGASIVAGRHGISTRHIGDILTEFACADVNLAADACLGAFNVAIRVSAPPAHSRPSSVEAFTCARRVTGCAECDRIEGIPGS